MIRTAKALSLVPMHLKCRTLLTAENVHGQNRFINKCDFFRIMMANYIQVRRIWSQKGAGRQWKLNHQFIWQIFLDASICWLQERRIARRILTMKRETSQRSSGALITRLSPLGITTTEHQDATLHFEEQWAAASYPCSLITSTHCSCLIGSTISTGSDPRWLLQTCWRVDGARQPNSDSC